MTSSGSLNPDVFDFSLTTADHRQGPGALVPKELVLKLVETKELQMNPDLRAALLYIPELGVYRVAFQDLDHHEDKELNMHGDVDAAAFEARVAALAAYKAE